MFVAGSKSAYLNAAFVLAVITCMASPVCFAQGLADSAEEAEVLYQKAIQALPPAKQEKYRALDKIIDQGLAATHDEMIYTGAALDYCVANDTETAAQKDLYKMMYIEYANYLSRDKMRPLNEASKQGWRIGGLSDEILQKHLAKYASDHVKATQASLDKKVASGEIKDINCKLVRQDLANHYKAAHAAMPQPDTKALTKAYDEAKRAATPAQLRQIEDLDKIISAAMEPDSRILNTAFQMQECAKKGDAFFKSPQGGQAFIPWRDKMNAVQDELFKNVRRRMAAVDFLDRDVLQQHATQEGQIMLVLMTKIMQAAAQRGAYANTDCGKLRQRLETLDTTATEPKGSGKANPAPKASPAP